MCNFAKHIDLLYHSLDDEKSDKCMIYANIIELKFHQHLETYVYPVYVDFKRWVELTLKDKEMKDAGYDKFPAEKFYRLITYYPLDQQLDLLRYLDRKTRSNFISLSDINDKIIETRKHKLLKEKRRFQYFLLVIGSNFQYSIELIIGVFLLTTLIFIPAPCKLLEVYDTNLITYSDYPVLNYMFNSIAWLIGLDTDQPILSPINALGIIGYAGIKIILFGIIGNFIFQKITDFLDSLNSYGE